MRACVFVCVFVCMSVCTYLHKHFGSGGNGADGEGTEVVDYRCTQDRAYYDNRLRQVDCGEGPKVNVNVSVCLTNNRQIDR